jgi:hypothetical protein
MMDDTSTISRRSGGGERSGDACDAGSDWEHCGSPWQAEILVAPNLMIWSAAIYCTPVVQDIVVVG